MKLQLDLHSATPRNVRHSRCQSRRIFRVDAHVQSGHVVLPLIVRRICRYDCGGKWSKASRKKRERERAAAAGMWTEEPFRSCHGLRIAVTCLPQTRPSPKHVRLGLLLFIYPALSLFPSLVHSQSRRPLSFLVLSSSSILRRAFSPSFLLMSRTLHPGIDRCHRRTNTPERTCQRVLMPPVIVISTLIRTVMQMSKTFVCSAACALLNMARDPDVRFTRKETVAAQASEIINRRFPANIIGYCSNTRVMVFRRR